MEPFSRWKQKIALGSASIADSLARACIEARDEFPAALRQVRTWLQGVAYLDGIVHRLHELNLHEKFPEETLELLDVAIENEDSWPPEELEACLRAIPAARPHLETDRRFRRLEEYLRKHGGRLG